MRPAVLLAAAVSFLTLLASGIALAAPDEAVLGKAEGYPVCKLGPAQQRCLVGQYSHFDQVVPARVVKAGVARPLKRADKEPSALGVDAYLEANRDTGMMVIRDGTVLAERYQYERKPADRFTSMSMAKTVVSMLIGIALREGKISSIDDPAEKYVPALKGRLYGETKLRHLLTMSSGVKFSEDYNGKDDISLLARKTFMQQGPGGPDTVMEFNRRLRPAGKKFTYASAETEVLGLVLRAATGQPLADYLSEKIWIPMGAEADATWAMDAGGYEWGFAGLNATLRDWGRLGILLANYGVQDGKEIIPSAWIRAATRPESPHLRVGEATKYNGYGYQTWLIDNDGRFALLGVRGQGIFIDPATKLVVVHTAVFGEMRDPEPRRRQFEYFARTVRALAN